MNLMNITAELMLTLLANIIIVVGALVHITGRITEIHTDVKWIKRNCPRCAAKQEEENNA